MENQEQRGRKGIFVISGKMHYELIIFYWGLWMLLSPDCFPFLCYSVSEIMRKPHRLTFLLPLITTHDCPQTVSSVQVSSSLVIAYLLQCTSVARSGIGPTSTLLPTFIRVVNVGYTKTGAISVLLEKGTVGTTVIP